MASNRGGLTQLRAAAKLFVQHSAISGRTRNCVKESFCSAKARAAKEQDTSSAAADFDF
jgi:hypothetical protein